jgi:3-dehydroquinate synthase
LGGGALLREENRSIAETNGQVVFLDASLPTLIARLSGDVNERPLLAGELESKLVALLKEREDHYISFSLRVDASSEPEQIAWEVQRTLGRYHVWGMRASYDVLVQENGLKQLGEMLKTRGQNGPVLVVSDTNVGPLYAEDVMSSLKAAGYLTSLKIIPAGEEHKTLETVSSLWRACLEARLDRKSAIIALGGGVVSDLAGFAAATFMRGVQWIGLPTTVLSMVDASIGGKTGFDLPEGKNLIGSFYPPGLVLADPNTLFSLPDSEFRSGLAEVVKHSVIADSDLFEFCSHGIEKVKENLGYIICRAMGVKVRIIQEDPYEKGIRAALNLGHTVGHAVELVSGFKIRHGEAVSIGMVAEARLAERLTVADKGLSDALMKPLASLGLPVEIPEDLSPADIIRAMKMDKKKVSDVVRFALPVRIGEVKVGIEVENLEDVL